MKFDHIRQVAIVGAGTMGAGIGLCFAQAGYDVSLFSKTNAGLDRAKNRLKQSAATFTKEKLFTPDIEDITLKQIRYTTRLENCLNNAQFVLESVPEQLKLKQDLFRQMELLCPTDTILATNTSGLGITEIAFVCEYPERVIGLHWANPAEIVPLVEVIRGKQTTNDNIDLTFKLAENIGKMPVKIEKEVPGFASNRLQFALLREALHLVESGVVTAQDVDKVLKGGIGFRYPWLGPLETADLGGLDVFYSISEYLFEKLSKMETPPSFFNQVVEKGKLGIKTGEGFYKYRTDEHERILRERDLYFIRQLKLIRKMKKNNMIKNNRL